MFLSLHQDTRSSNSLRIHNSLSSNVQCHCPSCLLTTPLGSNHMQKKKKILHWAWEETALLYLGERGFVRMGVQTPALPSTYQLYFHVIWPGLCFLINTYLPELFGNVVKFSEKINLYYSLR